ncbi:MAG: histidine phosphatase family protein [Candidatus Omnitrophota bacterium]
MPTTRLILIRHGETEFNLKKRYCGFLNVSLSERGKKQAQCLHERLKRIKIHKVYSSDRTRAIQTAEIVFKKARIEKNSSLREIHFGCFEGLTYDEIMQKYPDIYKKWLKDPFSIKIPKGEHLRDFKKRITKTLNKIISGNRNKTIALVCHGGAISIFITGILKTRNFWEQIPRSASMSIVEYKNNTPKIKSLNDISHLKKYG